MSVKATPATVGNSGNANVGYQGGSGNVNVGYSYGKDYRQLNYSVRGGVIVHSEGVTLSQPLGETMTLISVPVRAMPAW